ncbi:hypothetical protein ACP70R_042482 [Stipagrostis hirtigluma subsp. patula]
MPIAFDSGRRGGGASFGHRGQGYAPGGTAEVCGGSSSGRRSDSRAAVLQCEEGEEGDGEVQSSYRGPFDTMDALQGALPSNRRAVSKFYNGKSRSEVDVMDAVPSPQQATHLVHPDNSSPKKRKGLLPFSFSWKKSRSKDLSSRDDVANSTKSCRKTSSPAVTSSSRRKSTSSIEHECCQNLHCHCLQRRLNTMDIDASPPVAALRPRLISVQMKPVSVAGVQDVSESTAQVSPREKRRKN